MFRIDVLKIKTATEFIILEGVVWHIVGEGEFGAHIFVCSFLFQGDVRGRFRFERNGAIFPSTHKFLGFVIERIVIGRWRDVGIVNLWFRVIVRFEDGVYRRCIDRLCQCGTQEF